MNSVAPSLESEIFCYICIFFFFAFYFIKSQGFLKVRKRMKDERKDATFYFYRIECCILPLILRSKCPYLFSLCLSFFFFYFAPSFLPHLLIPHPWWFLFFLSFSFVSYFFILFHIHSFLSFCIFEYTFLMFFIFLWWFTILFMMLWSILFDSSVWVLALKYIQVVPTLNSNVVN